jgi:hypothetical protein
VKQLLGNSDFVFFEGGVENACKIKEIKIDIAVKIKCTKLILYYINNVMSFSVLL